MEDKYTIGEKEYSREELLAFGKAHYPKFYWIYRGVGIGLMFIGILTALVYVMVGVIVQAGIEDSSAFPAAAYYSVTIPMCIIALVGAVVFAISFKKQPDENYIKHAIDYYTKADLNKKAREERLQRRQDEIAKKEENKDINQLVKYKELLDKGVITQEEFEAKKKELL